MKFSVSLSRRAQSIGLHWRISATRDAILLFGVGIISFGFAHAYELPPPICFNSDWITWIGK
jgi:hypothetical protein